MSYGNPFERQISNRNFLSPTGFKFTLQRAPKVAFFGNSANLPAISMGTAIQPTYLKDIDRPGDKVDFGDFNYRFLVDEDLEVDLITHKVDMTNILNSQYIGNIYFGEPQSQAAKVVFDTGSNWLTVTSNHCKN